MLDPLNSRNHVYLARSLRALGRYDEADAEVRKAIEFHPEAAQSYSELAITQIQRGNPAAAVGWPSRRPISSGGPMHWRWPISRTAIMPRLMQH